MTLTNKKKEYIEKIMIEKENDLNSDFNMSPLMRRFCVWAGIIAGGAVGTSYILFVIYWTWQEEGWVKDIIKEHFASTVGLPLAAVGSFLLVTVLQISAGKIEFEAYGFKFRGASGQVVLWICCFLAIAVSIRLLW